MQTQMKLNENIDHRPLNLQSYILDPTGENSKKESDRLDKQTEQRGYRPIDDLRPKDYLFQHGYSILDAGCGPGAFSKFLANQNTKIRYNHYLIDSDEQRVSQALERVKGIHNNVTATAQRIEESFDAAAQWHASYRRRP